VPRPPGYPSALRADGWIAAWFDGLTTSGMNRVPGPTCGGYPARRAPPGTWTFLSSLGKTGFFSSLLIPRSALDP